MLWQVLRVLAALVAAVVIYVIGAGIVAKFRVEPEEEPDPENLRPVEERFECIVCGARVTMTAAQRDGEVEAPRHCREDMIPVE